MKFAECGGRRQLAQTDAHCTWIMDMGRDNEVCAYHPFQRESDLQSFLMARQETYRVYSHYDDIRSPPQTQPIDIPMHVNICQNPLETRTNGSTTLQSVLLGEVPAAYSHLTTHRISPSLSASPLSHSSTFSMSPSPSPNTYHQEEPIDLSLKATKSDPMDLNISVQSENKSDFSILRSLLCIGKNLQNCQGQNTRETHQEESFHESYRSESPLTQLSRATRVTLAKKNMFPVSSRVSDWLLKIVQFAKTIPEFTNLSHNDKVTLILNSWTRLLLLYMAENNFQFAVTPLVVHSGDSKPSEIPAPDQPTMKSVEGVQSFIKKCQNMDLDQKEYAFLRMVVLFNADYAGLDRPDVVEQLNFLIQQLLQQHVQANRPDDVMHYSHLLLCLPTLYSINSTMIENLFCRHINGSMDMEVLLKEMLQNL